MIIYRSDGMIPAFCRKKTHADWLCTRVNK
nr:MAG TPA: hypothetical protein [Caudoviricetes sp.]